MIVSDISDEAVEILGECRSPIFYRKISRAVQVLAKKGNFDSLLLYLDMNVQSGNILTLPREVEVPIKVNINRHPAFSRDRLFEFSQNGPGSNDAGLNGWQWLNQGRVPVMADMPSVGSQITVVSDAADNGKHIKIWGLDINAQEITDDLVLNAGATVKTANFYRTVRRVRKDETSKRVQLLDKDGAMIANYYGDEVEPQYRQIRLSKKCASIHMLFRRRTDKITGEDDYIPLDSEQAVLFMLRALYKYSSSENGQFTDADALQAKALEFLNDDQVIRDSAAALAQNDQFSPAWNLNINQRDSIIVADIYDDAAKMFGPIGREKIFDRITEALEILKRKHPAWSGTDGYVDIVTDGGSIVPLPRYVDGILGLNLGGKPLIMRNRFFEFHLNGPGSRCPTSCRHWDDLGIDPVLYHPPDAARLVVVNDLEEDDGASVRIFGYDSRGRRLRTPNNDLDDDEHPWVDGIELFGAKSNTLPNLDTPKIKRIERIQREETHGFQSLIAYSDDNNTSTLVGYYHPDETQPLYRKIKLPKRSPWVRLRYRKNALKTTSLTDPLHLRSRTAILHALRSLASLYAEKPDPAASTAFEGMAERSLIEEEAVTNPQETFMFQMDSTTDLADPLQGQY